MTTTLLLREREFMKWIATALLLFMGSGAAAQNGKPTQPAIALIAPRAIRMEQRTVLASDIHADSAMTVVADISIPSAPSPAIAAAVARPIALESKRSSAEFKTFSANKENRALVAIEFLARGLDAMSTHHDLADSCKCYHEGSRFFGLDMTPVLKTTVGAYSYSFGIATAYSLIAKKSWNASKDHPRHGRLLRMLPRALLIGDSSMEIVADVRNFKITGSRPRIH